MRHILSDTLRSSLLDRFLRYVGVGTDSDAKSDSSPSSPGQWNLARLVAKELECLGCSQVGLDDHAQVYARIPSNLPPTHAPVPKIGLIAHLDTYFGTSGHNVQPQVLESYDGGSILLQATGMSIEPVESPNLSRCIGHTLITSDGRTLLGADDKAGVAEIVTVADYLLHHMEILHGEICLGFTSDEEIGLGTRGFDLQRFGADFAYTLDGSDLGDVEDETFCADSATISIQGIDIHPGYAKDRLVNAVRVAGSILTRLPNRHLPETTEGRESFVHVVEIDGNASEAIVSFIVRAFTESELAERHDSLKDIVGEVQTLFPQAKIQLTSEETYRNMAHHLAKEPHVVELALQAVERAGLTPSKKSIRGGTDGAQLSAMGLLTPNLFAGGQDFHSLKEWVSLEWMSKSVETALHLIELWREFAHENEK